MSELNFVEEPDAFGIGRGTGRVTIQQLRAEINAGLDAMGVSHTHGQGSAWGRGATAAGRDRQKMLGHAEGDRLKARLRGRLETESAPPHTALANGDPWALL